MAAGLCKSPSTRAADDSSVPPLPIHNTRPPPRLLLRTRACWRWLLRLHRSSWSASPLAGGAGAAWADCLQLCYERTPGKHPHSSAHQNRPNIPPPPSCRGDLSKQQVAEIAAGARDAAAQRSKAQSKGGGARDAAQAAAADGTSKSGGGWMKSLWGSKQ